MSDAPLAITMGDPAGIGAEITVQALEQPETRALGSIVMICLTSWPRARRIVPPVPDS